MATTDNTNEVRSSVYLAESTVELSSAAINDVVQMVTVPKGYKVAYARLSFDALGASTTLDLGDGADDDRYIAATSTASAGTAEYYAPVGGAFQYTSKDTIDITVEGATASGTVTVQVWFYGDYE